MCLANCLRDTPFDLLMWLPPELFLFHQTSFHFPQELQFFPCSPATAEQWHHSNADLAPYFGLFCRCAHMHEAWCPNLQTNLGPHRRARCCFVSGAGLARWPSSSGEARSLSAWLLDIPWYSLRFLSHQPSAPA